MKTTIVELPVDLHLRLKEVSERTRRSDAELLEEAINAFLRQQDQREDSPGWPRSIGIAADAELSSADIEDWLAANWDPEADRRRE